MVAAAPAAAPLVQVLIVPYRRAGAPGMPARVARVPSIPPRVSPIADGTAGRLVLPMPPRCRQRAKMQAARADRI
jgi:hypothetical protein